MANYEEARVKLTNSQINNLNSAAKSKTGTTLRITRNNFQDEELPHELFLTTRRETKIRNVFANNMLSDIKLSKAQLSKIIQSGIFHGALLDKLAGPLMNVAFPLAKNVLVLVATMASLPAVNGAI